MSSLFSSLDFLSSCLLSSLLSIFSSLVLSLLFHLLLPSCLVVFSCLSFSVFSFSLSLSVSLCLCLRVDVVCCGTLKNLEKKQCVDSKTPPCVHSKRPRVCRQHAQMCFNMCAWCRYTRGRSKRTHWGVSNGHTERRQVVIASSAYQNLPTYGYHVLQRFTKETFGSFPFSRLRID